MRGQFGNEDKPVVEFLHTVHKYDFYYGYKECNKLGLNYTIPDTNNIMRRSGKISNGELVERYRDRTGRIVKQINYGAIK